MRARRSHPGARKGRFHVSSLTNNRHRFDKIPNRYHKVAVRDQIFAGNSEMTRRMRDYDWMASPPARYSRDLRTCGPPCASA